METLSFVFTILLLPLKPIYLFEIFIKPIIFLDTDLFQCAPEMYQGINGNRSMLNRGTSQICPTPEEELYNAVLDNQTEKIELLITNNRQLLNYVYPVHDKPILIIACSEEQVNAETVDTLLNLGANPKLYTDEGWIALHWTAQRTDYGILKVLLDRYPNDINEKDLNGNNALHILIRHGKRESSRFLKCVELLLNKGINYNQRDNKNKTPLDWAQKKGIADIIQPLIERRPDTNNFNNNLENSGKQLLNYLKQNDENNFINYNNGNIQEYRNYSEESTLLQFCCQRNFTRAAKHLLENGADPNKTGNKNLKKPIFEAAEHGNAEIFEALLDKYHPVSKIPEGLLPIIVKYIDDESHGKHECYKIYINKIKSSDPDEQALKLNEADIFKDTALHHAIRHATAEDIEELLRMGASLGAKNQYGKMPIEDLEVDMLQKHLDNCLIFDEHKKEIHKQDFHVKINYRSLIPPYSKYNHFSAYKDVESTGITSVVSKQIVSETEVIAFMGNSAEFKHLLKHPVIVSFLLIKWLQIQWLFWANLSFYITFALSLVVYIFSKYSYFGPESTTHTFLGNVSYSILFVTYIIFVLRELFQIFAYPSKYVKNLENYFEIILLILTSMIVFTKDPSYESRKQISSLVILLSAFDLVLMLGQHPYFSTNVVMLRRVSYNFFRFLIWYSLLIVAFALSFYLLFASTNLPSVGNSTEVEGEDQLFNRAGDSVFKTIIMLTGEFEAGDMNFNTFPITSKLIFILFVFMIAIILLNLLNGLAVSDTQMIQNDSELVGHIARAQHIRYAEEMFTGNILPTNFMKKLSGFCCCLPIARNWDFKLTNCMAKAFIFPKQFNYELVFYPNKNGLVLKEKIGEKKNSQRCIPCAGINLDKATVKRTKDIVQRKIEQLNYEDPLRKIEERLNKLQTKIDQLLNP